MLDVHEKDGVITHLCDRALPVGAEISGHIDWTRRFDHMQQHSGEHIVSGMLCSAFHCDNVGFHMGADVVTIDYNADISWEQVLDIERRANQYIWEDHPVHIWYPSPAELAALPYRSKKALEGAVRITEFPGADICACCGTHVTGSGQDVVPGVMQQGAPVPLRGEEHYSEPSPDHTSELQSLAGSRMPSSA